MKLSKIAKLKAQVKRCSDRINQLQRQVNELEHEISEIEDDNEVYVRSELEGTGYETVGALKHAYNDIVLFLRDVNLPTDSDKWRLMSVGERIEIAAAFREAYERGRYVR